MVFRRVDGEQYAALVKWCLENDIKYELKAFGRTLMFGLQRGDWRKIDFGAPVHS